MCPSTRQYHNITACNHLPNSPVCQEDIAAAEKIFGTSIGSLKGKTVSRTGTATEGDVDRVPQAIMEQFQTINLFINIMYVSQMPFLITTSRGIQFGMVKHLNNQQSNTVGKALN